MTLTLSACCEQHKSLRCDKRKNAEAAEAARATQATRADDRKRKSEAERARNANGSYIYSALLPVIECLSNDMSCQHCFALDR